ncbi:MAG: methyltransferase domain-containing protein [Candidatus Marinimicrobia bacterium]|nr:methyltransferase domain-containing protein [Candidatus Neomarinimicrobiota bacterium]
MFIDDKEFDFIDFGASKGGCIEFAKRSLKGKNGLGVDISPQKVLQMQNLGYECVEGDITCLDNIPDKSVRFVTISHVLEHLPSISHIEKTLKEAIRISTDFIFIHGPYFDEDDYLADHGLKFYWSDWHGHTYHLRTNELDEIITNKITINQHKIMARVPVIDSSDPCIHPIESPIDQHDYNEDQHPIKKTLGFNRPIYKEFVCYMGLRNLDYWDSLVNARKGCIEI